MMPMSHHTKIDLRQAGFSGVVISFFLVLFIANASAATRVSVYDVAGVRLDVNAENAVEAKQNALRDGPLIALRSLFRRLATFRAYGRLSAFTHEEAEDVMEGFSVREERNSATRYLAVIDYSFSPDRIEALLARKGVPYFAGRSRKQYILPIFVPSAGGGDDVVTAKAWREAWKRTDLQHALTDSRLIEPKSGDLDTWRRLCAGDVIAMGVFKKRYPGSKMVIAALSPDVSTHTVTLSLYGEDQVGEINLAQRLPQAPTVEETAVIAASIAFGILEGRWREPQISGEVVTLTDVGPQQNEAVSAARLVDETVFLRVAFDGLRDWQKIRARLQRVPGVRDMQVNSLSPRGADVRLAYPGGASRLQAQLSSYGFRIDQSDAGLVLSSTN